MRPADLTPGPPLPSGEGSAIVDGFNRSEIRCNGFATGDGGAIDNRGTLTIDRSTFQNNTSEGGSGGAIVSYGPLTISNSSFVSNRANNGGALYPRFAAAQTTLSNTILRENRTTSTTDGWGGAILLWEGATVDISGGEVISNTANVGGGLHNGFANSSITLRDGVVLRGNLAENPIGGFGEGGALYNALGQLRITGGVITGNRSGFYGGGIANTGTMTITAVQIANNRSRIYGGGVKNDGTATLTDVTLAGNEAGAGTAGIDSGSNSTLTLTNTTISGNQREPLSIGGNATLINVTVAGNTGRQAVSIYGVGSRSLTHVSIIDNVGVGLFVDIRATAPTLRNVVLAGNLDSSGASRNCANNGSLTSQNSLSSDTTCTFSGTLNRSNTPALLGPLADNGGSTQTHLPQPGSPLINGGVCVAGVTTDQRGVARLQGAACDIGAVEVGTAPALTPSPTPIPTPNARKIIYLPMTNR